MPETAVQPREARLTPVGLRPPGGRVDLQIYNCKSTASFSLERPLDHPYPSVARHDPRLLPPIEGFLEIWRPTEDSREVAADDVVPTCFHKYFPGRVDTSERPRNSWRTSWAEPRSERLDIDSYRMKEPARPLRIIRRIGWALPLVAGTLAMAYYLDQRAGDNMRRFCGKSKLYGKPMKPGDPSPW